MSDLLTQIIEQDEHETALHSIKLGFCRAMSDFGFTPRTAEEALNKAAEAPGGWFSNVAPVAKFSLLTGAGLGAAAGVGSAMLRRNVEKTIQGRETPEMRSTRQQINMYKRMITGFKEEQGLQDQGQQLKSSGTV